MKKNNSEYLKVGDVASILNVTPKHIYNLIDVGRISAIDVGIGGSRRLYRILRTDLEVFQKIDQNRDERY